MRQVLCRASPVFVHRCLRHCCGVSLDSASAGCGPAVVSMAGSGVALRLHEFRESEDSRRLDGPTPKASRLGRDVHGLYPGQLGRVHIVHSDDFGPQSGRCLQSPNPPCENYQQSFDVRTLRALTVPRLRPAVPEQRPPQTAYQDQFGVLQSSSTLNDR